MTPSRPIFIGMDLSGPKVRAALVSDEGHVLGPSYREVLPLALALAWLGLRRLPEAEEQLE